VFITGADRHRGGVGADDGRLMLLVIAPGSAAPCAPRRRIRVAGLMGVNINAVISATFVIGSALAAVAGVMVAPTTRIAHYHMGFMLGLKAFTAAVLGGIGNLPAPCSAACCWGSSKVLGAGYIGDLTFGFLGSHYQDIFAFSC
jgi:branched-chain amino acid transport system permease protein